MSLQKEKIKINFDESKIKEEDKEKFEEEVLLLLDETEESPWRKSAKSEFWNLNANIVKTAMPIFHGIFMSMISLNANKDVRVTLREYEFSYNDEFKSIGRIKPSNGKSSNSQYKSYPLAELFFGTIQQCNDKINQDPNSRWYFVDQYIHMQDSYAVCFATLKRNKSVS